MVLLSEINLLGLYSGLSDVLENKDSELQIHFDLSIINDFNNRKITPKNFNEIIILCDYLNIKDTEEFIIKNSVPTFNKYQINEDDLNKIKLPNIMTNLNLNLNLKNKKIISEEIAKYNLLNWLEFIIKNKGIELIEINEFSKYGNLKCLKYAHEKECYWDDETCECAAKYGKLECLKYAHENGCDWDEMTCTLAARHGHLECLKYAHENGCNWSSDAPWSAAENGHLRCLEYLYEQNCLWTADTCQQAAEKGHLECLRYAYEKGCPLPENFNYEEYISKSQSKKQKI